MTTAAGRLICEADLRFYGGNAAIFFRAHLQILRSSLIITGLFGGLAHFRCGNSFSKFIFSADRMAIVQ
ncbi:MAG: hypothetical protein DMG49_03115 [Acidobacteria bacterium]|nr:MAG: hypothetical protein DMG49_03115 [Acidobacteriota bacterium]